MNYPVWDVPWLGSGWVIGSIAIFHIMISHFAIGGGLYLPLAERKALKEGRRDWLEILHRHARFFLVLTSLFGAVSGVGIWFSIGLAHPEATSTLIHNFVFAWAVEWVFFLIELTSAAVYYYTWGRVPDSLHLKVGWVYAVSSFFTLFIINGILAFMLTPGDAWVAVAGSKQEATRFWQAFFNPTFWPNLLMRTLVCLSLAGVWALVTCSRIDQERSPELKAGLVRWSAQWLIPVFILLPLAAAWYVASVPEGSRALMRLGVSTVGAGTFAQVTRIATMVLISSVVVVGVVYLFAWRSPQDLRFSQALTVVFLALIATGSGEYTREMLRKPFVIGRHMYSNGLRVADTARANQDGYLGKSLWRGGDKSSMSNAGQAMFRGQCMSCHTLDGYRSMRRLLAGRNREAIGSLLKILHEHKPDSPYRAYMPPLVGTESEISALGDYLAALTSSNAPAAQTNRNASAVR